jgi:phosphopantetheine--protein transferase-like protein
LIGNDIVDLQYFESPRYQHIGYLERVCTAVEAREIRESENPARALAVVWAAKEAAYKLLSRELNLPHFGPHEFATDFDCRKSQGACSELKVSNGQARIGVTTFETARWVHAVASFSRSTGLLWRVRRIRKPSLRETTPQDESLAARRLANEFLQEFGWKDVSVNFEGKIPMLTQRELACREMAISLSHHGRFVAAAIACSGKSPEKAEALCAPLTAASLRAA